MSKKLSFILDLDSKEFIQAGKDAQGMIQSIDAKNSMGNLINGFKKAAIALGPLLVAGAAFKKSLDFIQEAEHLRQIETQFQTLSEQAGVSGHQIKRAMEEASGGLLRTSEMTELANKSFATLGKNTEKLPELIEIARKASLVFGGDLKQNYEMINNEIVNASSTQLAQIGIVFDQKVAIEEYAKANGLAVNEVSQLGKQQAILNKTLEIGKSTFQNVSGDLELTASKMTVLKNTLLDLKDSMSLTFEKTMGPLFGNLLEKTRTFADEFKNSTEAIFGEGVTKATATVKVYETQIKKVENQIDSLNARIEKNKSSPGLFIKMFGGAEESNRFIQDQIHLQEKFLDTLKEKRKKALAEIEAEEKKSGASGLGKKQTQEEIFLNQVRLQNQVKYQRELLALEKSSIDQRAFLTENLNQVEDNINARRLMREQEFQQAKDAITADQSLNEMQKQEILLQQEALFQEGLRQFEIETYQLRNQLLDQYVENSQTAFDGIARAFEANAEKQRKALTHFGNRGQEVFKSFERHSVFAFQKMGESMVSGASLAEGAADAMKGFFLNMIADRSIAEGSMLLLSGLWPPNPIALSAGAGLLALGGALRTMAGGGAGKVAGATGGGVGVPSGIGVASPDREMKEMERSQRSVNVSIAGNYFDTDTSRRQLLEMIRQETDATDFTYNTI